MPRVKGFTETQKRENEARIGTERLRRGLFAHKGVRGITDNELSDSIGISRVTLGKLLRGEKVMLTSEQWFRVVSLAGYTVVSEEGKI